jgi:GntR family transcriptional repressor for pyruvate dehydrogenase complex
VSARSPRPTPRPTRADEVAETLKHRILSGVPAPGDKLPPELILASELHVNRFTVREAMNKLEQLRLIARKPGAGTVVLDYAKNAGVDVIEYLVLTGDGLVNTEVLANLLEFARLLSSEISALAADRHSDEDVAALDVIVARMRGEKNLSKLLWLDFDFNWTLCGAARNLVPRLLMNSVRELLEKYSHLLETLWVSPGSITQGYEHVVDAVRARDAERARSLMRTIWEGRHARFVAAARRDSRPPRADSQ